MRQFVNPEGTILFTILGTGVVSVATRPDSDAVWGPPSTMIQTLGPDMPVLS